MFQTHAVVGYLLGVLSQLSLPYTIAGSTMPDLLDRPLYWLGLVEDEHTVFHSLLLAIPGSVLSIRLFGTRGLAFAGGWLVHIAGDILNVSAGDGPLVAPSYVLFPFITEQSGDRFSLVSLSLPGSAYEYELHPVMLLVEIVLTVLGLRVLLRENGLEQLLPEEMKKGWG